NWNDYIDPQVLESFQKDTGIRVEYHTFATAEELDKALRSGEAIDVAVPSHDTLPALLKDNLLRPLDFTQLPNRSHLDRQLLSKLAAVDPDNRHAVPYLWGAVGLAINTPQAEAAYGGPLPNSWSLLFDASQSQRLKSCGISLLDAPDETLAILLNYQGRNLGRTAPSQVRRAAEALHVSQPTLSQQVRQLEEQLRVQLLDRSGRSVRPTDAGELYLLHARRALRELEAAQRAIHEVRDLSRGRLRLGMTPTFTCYLVGALVDPFNQRYPGIELSLEELPQDALEAALIDDRLDLGVAFSEPGSVEIDSQPLYLERLGLVLGAEHPAANAPLAAAALAELPLALLRDDFATRRHIDAYLRQQGVTARVALEANSISAIVDVVRRGRLASILPEAVARQQAGLRCVALRPALPTRQVALFWRQGSHPGAARLAFQALALELGAELGDA
ncbi:transcriptional regulator CynR, partial [Pseudomonas aeruginosa]